MAAIKTWVGIIALVQLGMLSGFRAPPKALQSLGLLRLLGRRSCTTGCVFQKRSFSTVFSSPTGPVRLMSIDEQITELLVCMRTSPWAWVRYRENVLYLQRLKVQLGAMEKTAGVADQGIIWYPSRQTLGPALGKYKYASGSRSIFFYDSRQGYPDGLGSSQRRVVAHELGHCWYHQRYGSLVLRLVDRLFKRQHELVVERFAVRMLKKTHDIAGLLVVCDEYREYAQKGGRGSRAASKLYTYAQQALESVRAEAGFNPVTNGH